jgi:hypothetical protein
MSGQMQTQMQDIHPLPSYADVVNPQNADSFPVLNCVPISRFLPTHAATAFAGLNAAVWEFQSINGAFKSFSLEESRLLESAVTGGLSSYEIPERNGFFDFKDMTQTNFVVMMWRASVVFQRLQPQTSPCLQLGSTRRIQRTTPAPCFDHLCTPPRIHDSPS